MGRSRTAGHQVPYPLIRNNSAQSNLLRSPFSGTAANDLWNAGSAALVHGAAVRREPKLCPICLSILQTEYAKPVPSANAGAPFVTLFYIIVLLQVATEASLLLEI